MRVAVVGGGPAGCAAAYTLRKQGHDVVLFEAQDHVGGRTSQVLKNGFSLGSGALFLMGGIYPRTNAVLKELGRYDELVRWDAEAEVIDFDGRRYTAKFDQVMNFLRMPALTWRDKLRIAAGVASQLVRPGPRLCFDGAELARYDGGENLETWSRRVLGERGTHYITVPYMGFLYAVPISWLSPALFHAVVKHFYNLSLTVPPKGAGQVCDWLVAGTPGLDLRLSTPVDKIAREAAGYTVTAGAQRHRMDAVIVAPEPGVAADLLADLVEPESTKKLRDCRYSDYAHVQLCYRHNPWPDHRASVALPANMERAWGACVLLSRRQPSAVPEGGEAVGVYFYTPPLERMSDDDIVQAARDAVLEVYGPAPEPDFIELFHYRRGLSIAGPGHYRTLNTLHAQMPKGIYLAGDYFAHAGIEAAILSGELAANRLTQTYGHAPTARRHPRDADRARPPKATLPPGQWLHADHPRFGLPWYAHRTPDRLPPLRVTLTGPDGELATIEQSDLDALPRRAQRSDFHCVTTWSRVGLDWEGVPFRTVYDQLIRPSVDPGRSAQFACFHGVDGYHDETSMVDLLAEDVLLATSLNGQRLSVTHGGPLRLVAPAHYGYKSVKHLNRIELRRTTRRRLPWSSHHPRGRVAFEERFLGLPDPLVRVVYRQLVFPPTLWWYRRHARE